MIAGGLYLFLHRTRLGKALRAVANNREAAELVGIPSTKLLAIAFGWQNVVGLAAVPLSVVLGVYCLLAKDSPNPASRNTPADYLRLLRIGDGPDEVHLRQIFRMEATPSWSIANSPYLAAHPA